MHRITSINFSLKKTISFKNFTTTLYLIFKCGADSLGGDRLGCFNMSIRGHGYNKIQLKSMKACSLKK